jgi:fibro-slime domain-containing protein
MKIRKRWISLCLAIILLAGIAFNPGSLVGSQVEAANLEETGEVVTEESTQSSEEAVTVLSETPTDTSSTQPETTDPVTTETPTENTTPTEDTTVTETPVPETPAETPAPEITDTTPAEQPETNTGSAQTETGDNQQETNTEINTDTNSGNEETAGEQEIISERAVLKQEFVDENGNVKQTVIADIPEGAFNARADQLSMEVKFLDASQEEYIVSMMKELLPENENYEVGGYVLYSIDFKVDGVSVEPAKAVTISMTGNELTVKDTEKAHVFRYDPAEPEVAGDEDQLEEIVQKYQLEKNLNESGQGTANIEDYNYSEITVNNENADAISLKGTESGIYGCYVVNDPVTLEGTADGYHVFLTGPASSFPDDGELTLSVKEVSKKTDKVAEEAVEEEAEKEELQVVDYTALDITILKDGEEIQPLGPVNVTFTKEEKEKSADSKPDQIKVFHVDEETGKAQDMEATEPEEGKVEIETDHFSIYVVVDLDQLGGQIDLTVQHWATIEVLDGVNGQEGLVGIQGSDSIAGNNVVTLKTKNEFCQIYTDDVIKLDNKLNKNIEELSKVLLADANSEIKNYKLKEIWVLMGEGDTADSGVTTTTDDEKNTWAIYPLDDSEKTVTLKKDSTIRMVYEPVKADDALIQDVTFYDYDVTDGKRYNENGQEDSNGIWLNTTNQGINSNSNYSEGNSTNRLAVGQASAFVDHSYNDAKAANGAILNHGGGDANVAKKNIVKDGISENGPIYNGVYDAGLFNNDNKIGKTILNNYDLVFNQNGDTYTLSAVYKDGSSVLSNLEVLKDIYDGKAWPSGTKQIFSNNFWPLDTEDLTGRDPLMGAYSGQWKSLNNKLSAAASDDNKAHNWFFGMRYSFEFTLGDYTGPLNFYFRGDDDFWLYVDGKLATDLGGIHSSLGEILDLTPYVMKNPSAGATEAEKNATHTIEIVYAERGAYGSTCYMQFTLPNVKPVEFDTETPKTSVTVNKVWNDHNNPNRPASIQVELYYRVEGSNGEWTKYDTKTLSAANNWTYTWTNMPKDGYEYRVHEVGEQNGKFGNYRTVYSSPDGKLSQNKTDGTFSGTITNSGSPSTYITVNKVWNDGDDANSSRPDSVDFYLYYRNQANTEWIQYPNGKLTLTADGDWTGTYDNLPVYWGDTDQKMIYTVMEINGNDPLSNGEKLPGTAGFEYTVSYPDGYIENDFGKGYEAQTGNTENPQETLNLTVTNSLGVSIKVNKEWKGHDPENSTVIYAGLYKAGNPVADKWVELKYDNNWTATFQYLPPANDYSVKELRKAESGETPEFTINNVNYVGVNSGSEASVGNGDTAIKYVVSYSQLTQDTTDPSLSTVTITNRAQWQLIKYSSSTADKTLTLEGAEFELEHNDGTTYKGVSDANGIVKWTKDNAEFTDIFPDGSYTLTETAAPTGYALGDPVTFEMKGGVPVNMNNETAVIKDGILTFYYANEAIYSLPSSGSSGIYGYLLGGMLLMMAASLIVYKTKRGEVLKRK